MEQEFDDLFRDMDDVRKAVKRELEGLGGDRPFDAEVRVIANDSIEFALGQICDFSFSVSYMFVMNFPQDDEIILQDCDSDYEVDESRNKRGNGEIDDEEEKEDYSLRVCTCHICDETK